MHYQSFVASAEPKSSNQLANTADGHDADYQKVIFID
jgi:hypothetical protein